MGARGSFKGAFSPARVQQVQAGYFWDPASVQNSGAATFLIPEGNGKATHNMVTVAANTAPGATLINGQAALEYTNANPDEIMRVTGNVQRGFTGSVMLWGWVSMATAAGILFTHGRAPNLQFAAQFNAGDCRVYAYDGSGNVESRFPNPVYASGPFYMEAIFDDSQTATNRLQMWINRVQLTPNVAGTAAAALLDTAGVLTFAGTQADSSSLNISADFSHGVVGLTNGLPSAEDRDKLFNYRRLA
jgi:hypothetical protein